jgi:hypothetical protein
MWGTIVAYMLLHALKPHLDRARWTVALEYPGYLAHYQETGDPTNALEIRLGFDGDDFQIQWFRGDMEGPDCIGQRTIRWRDHLTIKSLAGAVIAILNTEEVE